MKKVEIFTDGSSLGNPGPGGWCAILRYINIEKIISGGEDYTTNNKMELKALIEALKLLKEPCEVELYTDSNYVKEGITDWIKIWEKNNWKTADKKNVKNVDLWKKLKELIQSNQVEWNWIKGHSENSMNDLADQLAKKATPI